MPPVGADRARFRPAGPAPVQRQAGLFPDGRGEDEAPLDSKCLIASAVITLFNVSPTDAAVGRAALRRFAGPLPPLTSAQSRARPQQGWRGDGPQGASQVPLWTRASVGGSLGDSL